MGTQIEFYGLDGRYEGTVTHYQDAAGTYQNFQDGSRAGTSDDQCVSAYAVHRPLG